MSKSYLKKISNFFQFKYNPENEMSVELLKKSKQLVLNNNNYNDYSNFYHSFTTRFTYKLPNVNIYPMQKNSEIISLREIKKNKDEKTEENKRKSVFQPILEYKKYSTISYTDNNENIKENMKLNNSNETINEKIFLNYIDKFNNMNNVMHNYITYRITYYVNKLDENKYLMSIIEKQKEDKNINIFDDKINCKLNMFNIYNDIQIKLIFNSIIIYIYDSNDKKIEKLKLPFCFVPFFYGISLQQFKLLLLKIMEFNEENNILSINKEKLNNNFKKFLEQKTFYNNLSFINNYKKISEFKFNWFVNLDINNYFKFKLLIKLPHFKTRIKFSNGKKLTFYKTIEIKHISYLIKDNYKDWDLFLLNTFCIYKDFRYLINNALSYNNEYKNNNYINFDENKSKTYLKNSMKNSLEFYIIEKGNNDVFKNFYFKMSSPYVEISYIKSNILENLISSKKIQLTFKEAIQLNKLRKSWNPEEIIKKCCIIKNKNFFNKNKNKNDVFYNNTEIDLNLNKYIFGFDESILKFIKKSNPIPDKKVTKKNFNIKLIPPEIHWSEKITEKLSKYSIEKKDYEKLFDLPLNEWEIFILKLLPKIKDLTNAINSDRSNKKLQFEKRGTYNFTNLKSPNVKKFHRINEKHYSEKKLLLIQE